jgi:UDP-N-acetylglucosamine 2-epimerase (hydrolysing)
MYKNFSKKKVVFITGTRAEYGKLKPVIKLFQKNKNIKTYIFVTGMHLLQNYGNTYTHIVDENKKESTIFLYKNKKIFKSQDQILADTILGFSNFILKIKPDLVVVHGDRVEALASSIAASINNFICMHIEGGEISGTIDEHIRHAVSKFSHIHLVANIDAKKVLRSLGEDLKNIHIVGSPDIDIMKSKNLPSLNQVKKRYKINFLKYSIGIFHPETTKINMIDQMTKAYCKILNKSEKKYILIYPNNDPGNDIIIKKLKNLVKKNKDKFIFLKSMRFEYFLTLLKNSDFIIGNSSAGIREAPFYGVPTIDLGERQKFRGKSKSIKNFNFEEKKILTYIKKLNKKFRSSRYYGAGDSISKIKKIIEKKTFWNTKIQKHFIIDRS